MGWSESDIPDLSGRTFAVTGGNAGIGLATVTALAGRGARVVVACRDLKKGYAAIDAVRSTNDTADVHALQLDLADMASIQRFSDQLSELFPKLHGLINNAGVMMPPLQETKDGFELQFGTNVLGHFALTGLLLPLLEGPHGARVVTVSSLAHWVGRLDFDNLAAEKGYSRFPAYAASKFANLMLAMELHRRLQDKGSCVASMAVHPGVTRSDLARYSLSVNLMMPLVAQSTSSGALPSLMAATAPELMSGAFLGPRGLWMRGLPRPQACSRRALNQVAGARLWDIAQRCTGVRYL